MNGIWVSSSGMQGLSVNKMYRHWQGMIPYLAVTPIEPPEPPEPEGPDYFELLPNVSSKYVWTINDGTDGIITGDIGYSYSVYNIPRPIELLYMIEGSYKYYWEMVDIFDIPETPAGFGIGLGEEYNIE